MKGIRGPKGIFVSYRHGDVDDIAGRIADAMRNRFGEKRVFFDDAIPVGAEWKDYIDRNLGSCRAALIVIGPKWISATDEEGEVKSEREKDYVAYEVQSVLAREPKIRCFPDELVQVWTNIIHNAIQATEGKGQLKIEAREVDQEIVVSISDNGPGIPPEVLERIFEPFFTTKPKGEGSGLGLGICQRIVDKHGGKIEANTAPGRTTFIVRLPMVGEAD